MLSFARADNSEALFELLRATELSGTRRRALLLHTDRLPPALAKAHHQRLARDAIAGLATADRAQHFELSRDRLAIVWRQRGGQELDTAMAALEHLLADLPPDQALPPGQLVTLYDLPEQAAWLMDEVADRKSPTHQAAAEGAEPLDLASLSRLEQLLTHADISRFMRWRPVFRHDVLRHDGSRHTSNTVTTVWQERYIAAHDIAANLCAERRIKADPWLFQRLTRSFDQRMLAILSTPQELRDSGPFALDLNLATILGPDFLHFDTALPLALRGAVTLNLSPGDILADPATFVFARNFARARGYKLLLRHASAALFRLLDVAAAGLAFCHIPYSPELVADPQATLRHIPAGVTAVLTGASMPSIAAWGRTHSFQLMRG
jgi:hypothetical protein